jgi:hypothetical protein
MSQSNITEFVDYLPFHAKLTLAARQAGIQPTAASTPDDKAKRAQAILTEIKEASGDDLVAKCVAFGIASKLMSITSVAPDLQRQAAVALLAQLMDNDPSGFTPEGTDVGATVTALNRQPGANVVAKAITLLQSRDPSFKQLEWREQCRQGGELVREILAGRASAIAPSGMPVLLSGAAGAAPARVQQVVDAVNAQQGPNAYAKANAYLCSVSATHRSLPPHEQHRVAGEFTRELLAGRILQVV